jgi:hypothetical protein
MSLIARWTIYENTDSPSDVPLVGHGIGPEIDGWTRIEAVPVEQLQGAVNLDDEAVIERATRALCDEEWWEDDWMTAMNVVGIVFQAAKGGQ